MTDDTFVTHTKYTRVIKQTFHFRFGRPPMYRLYYILNFILGMCDHRSLSMTGTNNHVNVVYRLANRNEELSLNLTFAIVEHTTNVFSF